MRRILAIALLAVVVTAGCTAPGGQEASPERTTAEPTEMTSETASQTTEQTETTTETTTDAEPQKGDQLLSVSELNESQAAEWNASKRAAFDNLSAERQQVVKQAIECDCNVELDGEFSFHDKTRIEVVRYDGRYYFLRVSIV